jgi:hypothetical protein
MDRWPVRCESGRAMSVNIAECRRCTIARSRSRSTISSPASMAGPRGSATWPSPASTRRHKQTTPGVQPCRSSDPFPIIGVPALLKLADWSQLRREQPHQGGSSCDIETPVQSPPAPSGAVPARPADATLASTPPSRSPSDAPDAQPRRRSTTAKASRRQEGRS